MRFWLRVGAAVLVLALILALVPGCGSNNTDEQTGSDSATTEQDASADTTATGDPETEVVGRPDEFPADVPLHPGTVTNYELVLGTEKLNVHQIEMESSASFDEIVDWYENDLPEGWSVGYLEVIDGPAREAKIALNGGDYTPASEDGLGGGVLIGVFEAEPTMFDTTVTENIAE